MKRPLGTGIIKGMSTENVSYSDPRYEVDENQCQECEDDGVRTFEDVWLCQDCIDDKIDKNRAEGCIDYQWFPFWRMDGKISNPPVTCCEHCLYDGLCAFTQPGRSHEA